MAGLASGYLVCRFDGREATLPLHGDPARLVQHCAAAFGVAESNVVGFSMGATIYPITLVGLMGATAFGGRHLDLLVKLSPAEEEYNDMLQAQKYREDLAAKASASSESSSSKLPSSSKPGSSALPASSRSSNLVKSKNGTQRGVPGSRAVTPSAGKRRSLRYALVGSQVVLVSQRELVSVRLLRQALASLSLNAAALMDLFSLEGQELMPRDLFMEVVEDHICPAGVGSAAQCQHMRGLLLRAFYALDVFGEELVPVRELLCGLILLTSSEEDVKFAYMFQLFDTDQDGALRASQLVHLFRSLLTFALSFNDGMSRLPSRYVYGLVDETCEAALYTVPGIGEENITLQLFWQWYCSVGQNLMPWVELYNSDIHIADALRWVSKLAPFGETSSMPPPEIVTLMSEGSAMISPLHRRPRRHVKIIPKPAVVRTMPSQNLNHSFDMPDSDDAEEHQLASDGHDYDESGDENDAVDLADDDEEEDDSNGADKVTAGKDADGAEPQPLFHFKLFEDRELVLMPIDAELVDLIISTTRISDTGAEEMYSLFLNAVATQDGPDLTKDNFDQCIRELVPGELLGKQEQRYLSYTFSTFFYAFDRASEGRVPTDEFLSGFMLLASGSKSQKLSLAFSLFDTDGEGAVDSIGLVRYLRSFLTFLFALQKDAPKLDAEEIYSTIDRTSVEVARAVYQHFGKADKDKVTFEEFGEWYNLVGLDIVPWLELLDLSKWPLVNKAAPGSYGSDKGEAVGGSSQTGSSGERLVFLVPLRAGNSPGEAAKASLALNTTDVDSLDDILRFTRLDSAGADEIHAALLRASRGSDITIDCNSFLVAVREIVRSIRDTSDAPNEDAPDFDEAEKRLRQFFKLYETKETDRAATDQVACGLSLLAQGNKSDKLAVGFALFDRDRDGTLSATELTHFLTALLLGLQGLTAVAKRETMNKVQAISAAAASEAVASIVSFIKLRSAEPPRVGHGVKVSFDDFAQWYAEGGGCERIPWVELYDLAKWPLGGSSFMHHPTVGSAAEDEEWMRLSDEILLRFNVGGDVDTSLGISRRDAYFVREVADVSGLRLMTAESLHAHLLQYSVTKGGLPVLNMSSYMAMINDLLDRAPEQSSRQRQRLMRTFVTIFGLFETQASIGRGVVRMNAIFCGLLLFTAGRKSDKFSLAFSSFDEDQDGTLTRAQLHGFLLAFLMGLRALPACSGKHPGPISQEDVADFEQLSEATVLLAGAILTQTSSRRSCPGAISFEEFCEWYTEGGYRHMAWLELLDLRKWQHALEYVNRASRSSSTSSYPPSGDGRGRRVDSGAERIARELGEVSIQDDEEDIIFRFVLTSEGDEMEFHRHDVAQLHRLLAISDLDQRLPGELYKALAFAGERVAESDSDPLVLSRLAFHQVIRQLIPGSSLSGEDKRMFSVLLSSIFSAFDRTSSKQVPLVDFACGFTVLSKGSKSEKLAHAFDRFDPTRTGKLTVPVFRRYLASFLTFLLALNDEACRRPAGEVWKVVDDAVAEIADRVFADVGLDEDSSGITFEQIATWYTSGGHEVLPWLELLSIAKWPQV